MFRKEHQNGINASASIAPNPAKAHSFVGSLDALCHKAFRPQNSLAKTLLTPFFPDPSQMGLAFLALLGFNGGGVPPSGGSLEIGNNNTTERRGQESASSPFGGIPRNWKHRGSEVPVFAEPLLVPPSGGSLEIGNRPPGLPSRPGRLAHVPPSGGSLEIGNSIARCRSFKGPPPKCSPFGGIPRNWKRESELAQEPDREFPLRGDP